VTVVSSRPPAAHRQDPPGFHRAHSLDTPRAQWLRRRGYRSLRDARSGAM